MNTFSHFSRGLTCCRRLARGRLLGCVREERERNKNAKGRENRRKNGSWRQRAIHRRYRRGCDVLGHVLNQVTIISVQAGSLEISSREAGESVVEEVKLDQLCGRRRRVSMKVKSIGM